MKLQPEVGGALTPLLAGDLESKNNFGESEYGTKYYQTVIDEANRSE